MSSILTKAFDATKKISRTIFAGSPNLFTTSDLNRQIEAIKSQLDLLDDKVGVYSDYSSSCTVGSNVYNVTPDYTFLLAKGASFSPAKTLVSYTGTFNPGEILYVCLTAATEIVTYSTDSSHTVAGALFADGSSKAAADQLVYKNEAFVVVKDLDSVANLVCVMEKIVATEASFLHYKNCLVKGKSASMVEVAKITDFNASASPVGSIEDGVSYDEALSIIEARYNVRNDAEIPWTSLSFVAAGTHTTFTTTPTAYARVKHGNLEIHLEGSSVLTYAEAGSPAMFMYGYLNVNGNTSVEFNDFWMALRNSILAPSPDTRKITVSQNIAYHQQVGVVNYLSGAISSYIILDSTGAHVAKFMVELVSPTAIKATGLYTDSFVDEQVCYNSQNKTYVIPL